MSPRASFSASDAERHTEDSAVCAACGAPLSGSKAVIAEFVCRLASRAAMQRLHPICPQCERKAAGALSGADAVLADVNARCRSGR